MKKNASCGDNIFYVYNLALVVVGGAGGGGRATKQEILSIVSRVRWITMQLLSAWKTRFLKRLKLGKNKTE